MFQTNIIYKVCSDLRHTCNLKVYVKNIKSSLRTHFNLYFWRPTTLRKNICNCIHAYYLQKKAKCRYALGRNNFGSGNKLYDARISLFLVKWIRAFLIDKSFVVRLGNTVLEWRGMREVPQASAHLPQLYSLCTHHFPTLT